MFDNQTVVCGQQNQTTWKVKLLTFATKSVSTKHYFFLLAALIATTIFADMMADDYYIASRLQADSILPTINDASLFNAFTVSDGQADTNNYLVQHGLMPWWTSPEFRFQMLRPLAEISHWIDFRLWPRSIEAMHLHHILWVFLFLFVAYKFLLRFSDKPEIGMLAFVFYSISANHSQTFAWLASRNTLMAASFGIAALLFHVKSRETGSIGFRVTALLSFAVALLASEFGLTASVWLFAWTLFLDEGHLGKKFVRLVPYGLVMMVWLSVYLHWNHGVVASEYYVNPAHNPVKYLWSLLEKTPTALFNAIFHLPAAGLFGSSLLWRPGWFASIILVVLLLVLIRKRLSDPLYKFYITGSLLSMIPIAAGSSGARTLAFVSLGVAPIIASILWQWAYGRVEGRFQKIVVPMFAWPVLIFTMISFAVLPVITVIYRDHNLDNYYAPANKLLAHQNDKPTMVLLNPNSVFYAIFYPLAWNIQGKEQPGSFYPLATGMKRAMSFVRDSDNSFVLKPEEGFLIDPAAYFMRSKSGEPFYEGQLIDFPTMSIRVLDLLDDGRPGSIRVRFESGMNSANVLYCVDGEFHQLELPAIGEEVEIPSCED